MEPRKKFSGTKLSATFRNGRQRSGSRSNSRSLEQIRFSVPRSRLKRLPLNGKTRLFRCTSPRQKRITSTSCTSTFFRALDKRLFAKSQGKKFSDTLRTL